MVNYYRDMWEGRSGTLAPLTKLCSTKTKFMWNTEQQEAFEAMKCILAREVTLSYPNFNKPFNIHTDASDTQLGAVISQEGKPIAFYSRKLSDAQTRYTTTERELLAIVETLKEFRTLLLGQRIVVYTDHKNLTYKVFNTERVMRWRLIAEEFGAELRYIKGSHNVVADALSRLQLEPPLATEADPLIQDEPDTRPLHEAFGATNRLLETMIPINFKHIQRAQQNDKSLLTKARTHADYATKSFRGGGKDRLLVVKNDKIVIPSTLQKELVQWYHTMLCHPGETRTEATIAQHFTWKGLRNNVHDICSKCHTCQITKRTKKKYGHLPEKEAEAEPWEVLCVDLIGPYKISTVELWCVTMIDPATGWFEIREVPGTKRADVIANIVEQAWLTRYPWPQQVILDRGTEFLAEFATMVVQDYGIKRKPISKCNPQVNAIVECVHQTIGNMICTF